MTAPTYGLCTHCRMWYALRPSGVVRRHRDGPVVCAGSKKAPESGDVGAAAIQAHATRQPSKGILTINGVQVGGVRHVEVRVSEETT